MTTLDIDCALVPGGQTVARGVAMPHSPCVHGGQVWMLHSGAGRPVLVEKNPRIR